MVMVKMGPIRTDQPTIQPISEQCRRGDIRRSDLHCHNYLDGNNSYYLHCSCINKEYSDSAYLVFLIAKILVKSCLNIFLPTRFSMHLTSTELQRQRDISFYLRAKMFRYKYKLLETLLAFYMDKINFQTLPQRNKILVCPCSTKARQLIIHLLVYSR